MSVLYIYLTWPKRGICKILLTFTKEGQRGNTIKINIEFFYNITLLWTYCKLFNFTSDLLILFVVEILKLVSLLLLFLLGCVSRPCLHGGDCLELENGGFYCRCKNGFSGDTCNYISGKRETVVNVEWYRYFLVKMIMVLWIIYMTRCFMSTLWEALIPWYIKCNSLWLKF